MLHSACQGYDADLVRILINGYGFDIYARDYENNTPIHVAAMKEIVEALIEEFGFDISVSGHLGRSLLRSAACPQMNNGLLASISKYVSPLVVDDNGDTPLHILLLVSWTCRTIA